MTKTDVPTLTPPGAARLLAPLLQHASAGIPDQGLPYSCGRG